MAARERGAAERSPDEIRFEIERTRTHLDETVDAIGDKLSPGRFVDELWVRIQSEGASAVTHTLREHPIPFALVGAGLGWLVYERASGRARPGRESANDRSRYDRSAWLDGANGEYGVEYDDEDGAASKVKARVGDAARAVKHAAGTVRGASASATETVTEKLSDAAGAVSDKLSDAKDAVTGAATSTKESISDAAGSAARGMSRGADRARDGFWQMLERNPLALGAVALGVGMAGALSVPRTRWEDERLGRFAAPLKKETKQVFEETAEKVKGVAQEAIDTARDEAEEKQPVRRAMTELKDSAEDIGRSAVDAARERGKAEDLTPEGMKKMAGRVGERTRDATKR
jgi:methyl-accepting chemotaxis protein